MGLIDSDMDQLKYEMQEETRCGTRIKVIGVGGGGCNAVARMVAEGVDGVEFYAMNTDLQALAACQVPNKLQLGVKVTLLEALDRLVPLEDEDISKEMLSAFKKAGIDCRLGVKVKGAKKARDGVSVDTEQGEVWARQLLVAVGRAPRSKEIGLEQVGVTTHPNGFIKVDEWMRTSAESIHAIGDVVGGYLLAHAAAHEGMTAVEDIAGQRVAPMEQELVTRCTYSHPQIASVGLTEKQAKDKAREVRIGKFPFTALGRAIIHGETGGFVKIVADAKTGQMLGAHIVGPNATELIAEPALTQLFQGDAWELGRNIHPHPTLSEAVMEAALAVDGRAIHI